MNRHDLQALALLGSTLVLAACGSDDPASPTPTNAHPAAVQLTAPTEAASGLDGAVTLAWQAAPDPDGDDVTYTVYLDEAADPTTELVAGLEATRHVVDSGLQLATTYHWKVAASDGKGGASVSAVRSFSIRGNRPPLAVDLVEVPDGATGITMTPTLTWTAAVDPDGDAVVYDVYLGTAAAPTTLVAGDIGTLAFAVTSPLAVETLHYWRVVAKDELGAESASTVGRFTTRPLVTATQATATADFAARSEHSSVVFDGKMWVIGGSSCCGGRFNDAWWSTDGVTWTATTENAAFPARTAHTSVVFGGKMWVMGGNSSYSSGNEFADVWSSSDGVTWVQETAAAEFGPRYGHRSVVFDGKIWIYAGRDAARSYPRSEIWQSSDGVTWTKVSDDAAFGGTSSFRITEFQGALWKTGGLDDRVFRSENGIDWTVVKDMAEYGERYQHSAVVFDDKLWLVSGSNQDNQTVELPDVWVSADGVDWQRAASDAGFTAVAAHTSVVFDDRMWVIAGGGGLSSFFVTNEVYWLGY